MTDRALDFLTYMVFDITKCNGAECKFCVYSDNPCGITKDREIISQCTVNNRYKLYKEPINKKVPRQNDTYKWSSPVDIMTCREGIRKYFMEDE